MKRLGGKKEEERILLEKEKEKKEEGRNRNNLLVNLELIERQEFNWLLESRGAGRLGKTASLDCQLAYRSPRNVPSRAETQKILEHYL